MSDKKVLNIIKDLAQQVIPQDGHLWLFGSHARGDSRSDSDWDLLVIVNKDKLTQEDYDNITYPFIELGWNIGQQINPIIYTKYDWENNSFTPFYHNVQQDKVVLL